MKAWLFAIALSSVLLASGFAEARTFRNAQANHQPTVHGKITAVGTGGFTMTVSRRGTTQTYFVRIAASTTVKGAKTLDASLIGASAAVQGAATVVSGNPGGYLINASSVIIRQPRHKK